jgi:hypothetical protein
MVVSGATSRARRVPRSVSRKRERAGSPPTDCAFSGRGDGGAAIARAAAATVGGRNGGEGRASEVWVMVYSEPQLNAYSHFSGFGAHYSDVQIFFLFLAFSFSYVF